MRIKKTYRLIFLMTSLSIQAMYEIKVFSEKEIEKYLPYIAEMRIKEFHSFPYLYEGSKQYEIEYLELYTKWRHTAIAIAFENRIPVGFLTGTALSDFDEHFKGSATLFKNAGLEPSHYYYFGEVIIEPSHRRKGLTRKLFISLENHARMHSFKHFCLATVIRGEEHPLKPPAYQSPDPIWISMGYQKTEMVVDFDWTTIQPDGSIKDQSNPLVYWVK